MLRPTLSTAVFLSLVFAFAPTPAAELARRRGHPLRPSTAWFSRRSRTAPR
ncbi:MAG: hypothetical protein U0792_23020 [Gemmataceae bacterium]